MAGLGLSEDLVGVADAKRLWLEEIGRARRAGVGLHVQSRGRHGLTAARKRKAVVEVMLDCGNALKSALAQPLI